MAVTATPVFVQLPRIVVSTSATTFTAGGNGSKVTAIMGSNAGAAVVATVAIGGVTAWKVTVALNAGDGTTASTNLMNTTAVPGLPVDNDGQPYFFLTASQAVVVTGANCTFTVIGADF